MKRRSCIPTLPGAALLLFLSACLAGCLGGNQVAGGSEVTNGKTVAGLALDTGGLPAVGARVWIRPSDYLRKTSEAGQAMPTADAITDARGRFTFADLSEGDYVLEIRDNEGYAAARALAARRPSTLLPPDTLRPAGVLEGRLELGGTPTLRSWVRVQGLERVVEADSQGRFSFPDIPAGIFRVIATSSSPELGYRKPASAVIRPGDTTRTGVLTLTDFGQEDYSQWPFSRILSLRITSGGAGETVTDFPLLVRLDSSRFDFTLSNGGDLRFSGPDGRHLAYEIERWDAAARRAEIWVRLDTVMAATPYDLTMHWGRLEAPGFSQGAAAFSSFGAAWHMGDALGAGGLAALRDASPYGSDVIGTLANGDRQGAVGNAGLFQGAQFLAAPGTAALKPDTALTLSAWFKATGSDVTGGEIASMGNNYGIRVMASGDVEFFAFDDPAWTAGTASAEKWKRFRLGGRKLIDRQWHHLAAVVQGDSLYLHLDGQRVGSAHFPVRRLAYVFGKDFRIGSHGNGENRFDFVGSIDEVQVSGSARSRLWIALAYETQKPGSTNLELR